jgi:type I restriction enzyme S subunit
MATDFPKSWELLPIADCMSAIIDYRGKSPRKTSIGIPLITAKIVKGGRILPAEEFIAPQDYDSWMRRGMPKSGDILLTTEAPLGEVAQLGEGRVALAQRLITLRGKAGTLDNTFLKFVLQCDFVQDQLRARGTGTTVHGIRQSELRKVALPIPPFQEQRAIAHVLGTLDEKIELNRRMNETLEAMARAIFKSWFVDFDPVRAKAQGQKPLGMDAQTAALFPSSFEDSPLGKIPKGWVVRAIGDVVNAVGGSTPRTDQPLFWDGSISFATPKDMSQLRNPILLGTERHITQLGTEQVSSGVLPAGTVLLSSRAPIGYLAVAEVPVVVNQGIIAMICDKELPNLYVLQWTRANLDTIIANANGTTFLEISKSNFRPIKTPVPPAPVLSHFVNITQPLYRRMVNNLIETNTLTTTRDALLPKLISGEIRIRDAQT